MGLQEETMFRKVVYKAGGGTSSQASDLFVSKLNFWTKSVITKEVRLMPNKEEKK